MESATVRTYGAQRSESEELMIACFARMRAAGHREVRAGRVLLCLATPKSRWLGDRMRSLPNAELTRRPLIWYVLDAVVGSPRGDCRDNAKAGIVVVTAEPPPCAESWATRGSAPRTVGSRACVVSRYRNETLPSAKRAAIRLSVDEPWMCASMALAAALAQV